MRRLLFVALCTLVLFAAACGITGYDIRGIAPASPAEQAVYAMLQKRHALFNDYRYASVRQLYAGKALKDLDTDLKVNARRYAALQIRYTVLDVREFEHSGDATAVDFYETSTDGGGTTWRVRADFFRTRNGWRIVNLVRSRS